MTERELYRAGVALLVFVWLCAGYWTARLTEWPAGIAVGGLGTVHVWNTLRPSRGQSS